MASTPKEEKVEEEMTNMDITFEMHVYEALFTTVSTVQVRQLERIKAALGHLIPLYQSGGLVTLNIQKHMTWLKNNIDDLNTKTNAYKQGILSVLEEDDTMALMNLTVFRANPSRYR